MIMNITMILRIIRVIVLMQLIIIRLIIRSSQRTRRSSRSASGASPRATRRTSGPAARIYYAIRILILILMLCYCILYHTILYYITLYYTILYYTILYYTILYYTIQEIAMSPKAHRGLRSVVMLFSGAAETMLLLVKILVRVVASGPKDLDPFLDSIINTIIVVNTLFMHKVANAMYL